MKFDCSRLGAIDSESNRYTRPTEATKDRDYKCIDCEQVLVFKRGKIKRPHFAHKPGSDCTYFDHTNESKLHKEAKLAITQHLRDGKTVHVLYNCLKCRGQTTKIIQCATNDMVVCEYRDDMGCRYDVAILDKDKDKVKYVLEVMHTHATTTMRPEPWFEVKAIDILETLSESQDGSCIVSCRRTDRNKDRSNDCENCWKREKLASHPLMIHIPSHYHKGCQLCDDCRYPSFRLNNGKFISICTRCIDKMDYHDFIALVEVSIPMFHAQVKRHKDQERSLCDQEKQRWLNARKKIVEEAEEKHESERFLSEEQLVAFMEMKRTEWDVLGRCKCPCGAKFIDDKWMNVHQRLCHVYKKGSIGGSKQTNLKKWFVKLE
jgi:hypothetical protein